jgi:hypothetical protein
MTIFKSKKVFRLPFVKFVEIGTFWKNRSFEARTGVKNMNFAENVPIIEILTLDNRNTQFYNNQCVTNSVPMFRLFSYSREIKKINKKGG